MESGETKTMSGKRGGWGKLAFPVGGPGRDKPVPAIENVRFAVAKTHFNAGESILR